MQSNLQKIKPSAVIALIVLGILLVWSGLLWRQRIFFCDASHIAFRAINEQQLQIQQFRFGAFITQMVPVIGAKLGLPIKLILKAYSVSFNLFFFIVGLLLFFGFRAYKLLVVFAFYFLLVSTHSYFWPNNEIHQGMGYLFLFFGALLYTGSKTKNLFLPVLFMVLLGGTALFCHPLAIFPFVFLWVYLIIDKSEWPFSRNATILLSFVAVVLVGLKLYVSNKYAGYDMGLFHNAANKGNLKEVLNAFSSPMAQEIYRHTKTNYWQLPLVFLAGVFVLFRQRKYVLAGWTIMSSLAFFVCICLAFGGYLEFYSESEIMPGIILMSTPFVFSLLPSLKTPIALLLVFSLCWLRLQHNIYPSKDHFMNRYQTIANIISKMKEENISKMVLVKKDGNVEWKWMLEWGVPEESILCSAINGDNPVRSFYIISSDQVSQIPKTNTEYHSCYETFLAQQMNARYFPLDTTQAYVLKPYEAFNQ